MSFWRMGMAILAGVMTLSAVQAQDVTIDPAFSADKAAVRQLQADFATLGLDVGKPDGSLGNRSKLAALAFAERYIGETSVTVGAKFAAVVAQAAGQRLSSPFDMPPAKFPRFQATEQVTWDINTIANPGCDPKKCVPVAELLVAGDLTGDAFPELVFATDYQSYEYEHVNKAADLVIFSRDAAGSYRPLDVKTSDGEPVRRVDSRKAVIADFNGDGVGDLFVATTGYDAEPFPGEQNVLLLSGPDGLKDVSTSNLPVMNDFAHGVEAADLDKDGDNDLVVITNFGKEKIEPYVLWNDGKGLFSMAGLDTILTRDLALFMAKGLKHRSKYVDLSINDLDGDGHLDFILFTSGDDAGKATNYKGMKQTRIVYGDGTGYWSEDNAVELPTDRWGFNTYTTDMAVGDLDGDGDKDLLATLSFDADPGRATNWRGHFKQILLAEGRKFVDATPAALDGQKLNQESILSPHHVHLVDLSGDGALDIVVGTVDTWTFGENNIDRQSVVIHANDGTGQFRRVDPRLWEVGDYTGRSLWPADFDGDGVTDLAAFEELGDNTDQGWIIKGMTVTIYKR